MLLVLMSVLLAGAGAHAPAQSGGILTEAEAGAILRAHIARITGRAETDVEIRSVSGLPADGLPDGPREFRVLQTHAPAAYRKTLVPVEAMCEGRSARTFWLTVDASVMAEYLTVAKRLPYGSPVGEEDVEMKRAELPDLRLEYLDSIDEVVGKTARRTLSAGDPLTRDVLAQPYLVRSGETVRLRLQRDGVALAAMVRAEQHGKLGQVIRVRNLDFGRPVKARVVARGEVTID